MPIIDLPLSELEGFAGRNPRPADFDRYWADALAELDALPATASEEILETAARFTVSRLTFQGVGSATVAVQLVQPKSSLRSGAAVLTFHGYRGSSGSWTEKLPFVSLGHAVLSMDVRGQGGASNDPVPVPGNTQAGHVIRGLSGTPEQLFYRNAYLDAARTVQLAGALPDIDPNRIGTYGGSQGGALALAAAALKPSVARVVATQPFLCDFQRAWELGLDGNSRNEVREYFRRYDPLHQREAEIFERLGYIDIQHLAPRITARLTLMVGLEDEQCPPSTQFAMYNRVRAGKRVLVYPDFGHEALPGTGEIAYHEFAKL